MISVQNKKLVLALCVAIAVVACGAVLLPSFARSSNCGGNSAALAACKSASLNLVLVATERGTSFSATNLTDAERESFRYLSGLSWLGTATVLVATEPVTADRAKRQLLVVCSKPFDNVPQRVIGKAPLRHAAGYSDGSAELISVQDFRKLDLSKFVDVRMLVSTNGPGARSALLEQKF